jgi:hypothetical protein
VVIKRIGGVLGISTDAKTDKKGGAEDFFKRSSFFKEAEELELLWGARKPVDTAKIRDAYSK